MTLKLAAPRSPATVPKPFTVARDGCSQNAAVAFAAHQREGIERLCRYVTRPAPALERLSTNGDGQVVYQLKTPYRDGTTHYVFDPLDFLARLAALVPRPRGNLVRYHGDRHDCGPRTRGIEARLFQPRQVCSVAATRRSALMRWAKLTAKPTTTDPRHP